MEGHVGCARFAYNLALEIKKLAFDNKAKIPNYAAISKIINEKKKYELSWMYKYSSRAPLNALKDCDVAFSEFFRKCKDKSVVKKGFPKFKSKNNTKKSFTLVGQIHIFDRHIKLPVIGKVRLKETDYFPKDQSNIKILSVTVSKENDRWFVSIRVETNEQLSKSINENVVGVDLGIKELAVLSDGTVYHNPKALTKRLKKLKRLSRSFSRTKVGSKNREKVRQKLSSLHYKIKNIRKDNLHKITSKIIDENQVIVIEDLKVSNMVKNKKISRVISDVGIFEFRRQLEYKSNWYGRKIHIVDTFFPSSKLCSCCGWKNVDLTLGDRIFECKECNHTMDRDLNASINLKNNYLSTLGIRGIYASEDGSSPNESLVSLSMKEEININLLVL